MSALLDTLDSFSVPFYEDKAFKHLLHTQECQNVIFLSLAESFKFTNTHPS